MERYSEYKDSGVQWLGEIPGHWSRTPFRRIASVKSNLVHPFEYADYPQIAPDSIEKGSGRLLHWKTVADSNVESDNHLFFKGQILYSKIRPLLNKVIIAPFDGLCSADMYPIETSQNTRFLQYYMLSNGFLEGVTNATRDRVKMPKINKEELGSIDLCIPPLSEQHSIVTYLDAKCAKIDKMLENKEKQIALLVEMKQRIIADAVTHGLNPDVKMKTTNNICLGDVPKHWDVMRYGTLFKIKQVKQHHGEELLSVFLNLGVIRAAESDKRTHAASEDLSKYQLVEPTDFVMNNQQAWRGSVGVSKLVGIISPAYHIFTMPSCLVPDFANYLLRSKAIVGQFEMSSRGVGSIQRTLNFNWLNNRQVPIPPKSEQQAIVTYLDAKCSKIDTLSAKLNEEISSIKEYKQRLISDVVTGQIKVC